MITLFGNLKGGSGKSTLSFNSAIWLATRSVPVGVFDLDPQRTLSDVAEVRADEGYEPQFSLFHQSDDLGKKLKSFDGEVVVDVGSSDMEAMKEAISVANRVVIPVPPSQADIWSTQRFLGIIQEAAKQMPDIYVFVNRADTHVAIRESDEAEEALGMLGGVKLISQRLHQRTAYRRSFSEGMGVFELEPSGKAAKEFVSLASILYPNY